MTHTNDDRPAPLVREDRDARRFTELKFDRDDLLEVLGQAICGDTIAAIRLAMTLTAWKGKPAGSLPADDRILARIACCGGDMQQWLTIKDAVLDGWSECSNGRLYHPDVAAGINASLDTHDAKSEGARKARERAAQKRHTASSSQMVR